MGEYLSGSYHLSRISTGSTVSEGRINLWYFNRSKTPQDALYSKIFVNLSYTGKDANLASKLITLGGDDKKIKIRDENACRSDKERHSLKCN